MSQTKDWKAEAVERRRQRERETDVEKRWQAAMDDDSAKVADWIKEVAMKKKVTREKDVGVAPWVREVQRTNLGLAKKMSDAQEAGKEAGVVDEAK